jgi:ornithine carbamoyltransferase/carbamoyltransferase
MGNHGLLRIGDLSDDALTALVARSCELSVNPRDHAAPLVDTVVGILFTRTSTRTRTAFTVGTIRLGGTPVSFGRDELQTNTGETLADTGAVLASMLDALVVRTAAPICDLELLSGRSRIPVVNAMAREEHPTQAITDLATLTQRFGALDGLRLLYVGEGNNTATALAAALSRVRGCQATFLTPPGYGLPEEAAAAARRAAKPSGATITETHDIDGVPPGVDVVYTTRWQTTGTTKVDERWRETFRPYYVDGPFMKRWPKAVFMHDLPAHRGEEVSAEVLDGPASIAWQQATMKLSSAMAVLEYCLG